MRVMLFAAALAILFGAVRPVEARPWHPFEPRPWYPWCARNLAGVDMDCGYISPKSIVPANGELVSGFCSRVGTGSGAAVAPPSAGLLTAARAGSRR